MFYFLFLRWLWKSYFLLIQKNVGLELQLVFKCRLSQLFTCLTFLFEICCFHVVSSISRKDWSFLSYLDSFWDTSICWHYSYNSLSFSFYVLYLVEETFVLKTRGLMFQGWKCSMEIVTCWELYSKCLVSACFTCQAVRFRFLMKTRIEHHIGEFSLGNISSLGNQQAIPLKGEFEFDIWIKTKIAKVYPNVKQLIIAWNKFIWHWVKRTSIV